MSMITIPRLIAAAVLLSAQIATASTQELTHDLQGAPTASPRAAHGARIYAATCTRCHARDAAGSRDGIVPSLASQNFRYLVKQITDFRAHDRFAGDIHDQVARSALEGSQAIADVAGYLSELPLNARTKLGSGENLLRGAELYRSHCASCHGAAAHGAAEVGAPALARQHFPYLARQMADIARFHRVNTPMSVMILMRELPREDRELLADYLSRLP